MRKSLVRIVLVLLVVAVSAGAVQAATPRILLVGDSWAWFMWLSRSFQTALEDAGLGEFEERGMYTTVPGSTSYQWVAKDWLELIDKAVKEDPTIDIVHLSIGGNGFLRGWDGEMADADRDKLFGEIVDNIRVIIEHCLALKPDMKVAICNYDYVNASRKSTIPELNRAGMVLAKMKKALADEYDRVAYIQNYGLMQHHFGFAPHFKPGEVPYPGQAPAFDPWPGGNDEYGSPPPAMMDKIHLSPEGYEVLAAHCIKVLYKDWLAGKDDGTLPPLAQAAGESEKPGE
jgi:lysophospholipase L1-like esterase